MAETRWYQVFVRGKTRRSKPRLLHKDIKGQKQAIAKAREWQVQNPDKYAGVYEVKRIYVLRPKKKK